MSGRVVARARRPLANAHSPVLANADSPVLANSQCDR